MDVTVSIPLAFAAGLVSFLSPCVLPVVPSCLAFVSGLSFEELRDGTARSARRAAVVNSVLFVLGFSAVFMTMGWAATTFGRAVAHSLPWLTRIGGGVVVLLGLYLVGLLRIPAFGRDARLQLSTRPAGAVGAFVVGIAFGAGWSPCIGPILASILLYTSLETTAVHGTVLLATYALGLGVPFVVASVGFSWFMAGTERVRRWLLPLERAAGAVLVVIGVMMVSGSFAKLTAFLAGLGQLIDLEMP